MLAIWHRDSWMRPGSGGSRRMSYLAKAPLSREQQSALVDIHPDALRSLPVESRVRLAYLHAEHQIRRQEAFWTAVQGFALGALPVLTYFGFFRQK